MSGFEAFNLGIVEGVTEFLPISSTGHLVLAAEFLGVDFGRNEASFSIIVQLAAILAVVVAYGKTLVRDWEYLRKVAIAFVPTALIGLVVHSLVVDALEQIWIIVAAIFVGGVGLIVVEHLLKGKELAADLTRKRAFWIGCIQALAFIPGLSRSAATIAGGMCVGLSRKASTEFSFLLAVPVMAAATGLELVSNPSVLSSASLWPFAIGFVVSFVVAYATLKWLIRFVEGHTLIPFGIYRILLAIVVVGLSFLA